MHKRTLEVEWLRKKPLERFSDSESSYTYMTLWPNWSMIKCKRLGFEDISTLTKEEESPLS